MGVNRFTTVAVLTALVGVTKCQKGSWMKDMSDAQSDYGYDLFDDTIFDIIWPGSADPGMYESVIDSDATPITTNNFGTLVDSTTLSSGDITSWCTRQFGDVEAQLNFGARFLQMSFTYDSSDDAYYSYQGVTGATASEVATQIDSFLTDNPDEFLILYLTNFDGDDDSDFDNLLDEFTGQLTTDRFASRADSWDFTQDSISDLQAGNSGDLRIIIFSDDLGTNSSDIVYDASRYFTTYNNASDAYSFSEVRTAAVAGLREGWDVDTMFLLDWRVRLDSSDSFSSYDGWYEYSRDINYGLSTTVGLYPKLRLGNVIMVDYFQMSDAIEQAIILNVNYHGCNDDDSFWGQSTSDCPHLSNLRNLFADSGESSTCVNQSWASNCDRSCGNCPYIGGVPGSSCNDSNPCDSAIYGSSNGRCFITDEEYDNFITEPSFCISTTPFSACASTDADDVCNEDDDLDTSICEEGCASNFQCTSGYCSSTYGICMSFNYSSSTTDAAPSTTSEVDGYDQVKSTTATQFRDDIEWLRPGDPNGNYTFDFTDISDPFALMDSNPYLTSIIGFILIPFVLSLLLFFCWFCTCVFWCCPCCEGCCKKCCCRMCLGENPQENQVAKWTPCAILAATMIVIVWACIEGIIYNSSMHDHIFAPNGTDTSVRAEIDDLFNVVNNKLGDIEPTANDIIDQIIDIVSDVIKAVSNTSSLQAFIDDIEAALGTLSSDYSGDIIFETTVNDPFSYDSFNQSLACSFCSGLSETIDELNRTITTSITDGLNQLESAINSTSVVTDANETIYAAVNSLLTIVTEIVNITGEFKDNAGSAFDDVKPYDEQREFGGFIFFSLPFAWTVFPILGLFLGTCLGKWCFKVNWCLAMFLGATVMLILSFFAVLTVGWADFCVKLDDFESALKGGDAEDSDIGAQLSAGLSSDVTGQLYDFLDVCFYGGSLLDIFNLTNLLDFDDFREQAADSLDIDIASFFESADFDSFETELELLDTSTFSEATDENLNLLNGLNRSLCFCPVNNASSGPAFTRELILNDLCSAPRQLGSNATAPDAFKDDYWIFINDSIYTGSVEAGECQTYYRLSYTYTFAEVQLLNQTQTLVNGIKEAGTQITDAFDNIYAYALQLEQILIEVTCAFDPLFDSFDTILNDYTSCTFIGDSYEGFKEVGCELLFSDMYHIARSMAMIAFLSIMVVYCSMCMDYVKDPMNGDEDDEDEFGNKTAVGSQTDPYSRQTEMGQMGSSRPSYVQGQDTQPGATNEGPGAGSGSSTHFV